MPQLLPAPGSGTQNFKGHSQTALPLHLCSQDAEHNGTYPPAPAFIFICTILFLQHCKSLLLFRVSKITWFTRCWSERGALHMACEHAGAKEVITSYSAQTQLEKYLLIQYLQRLKFKMLTFFLHHCKSAMPNIRDIYMRKLLIIHYDLKIPAGLPYIRKCSGTLETTTTRSW